MKMPKFLTSRTEESSLAHKELVVLSPLRQQLYDVLSLAIAESGQDKIITTIAQQQLKPLLANETDERVLEILSKIRGAIDAVITKHSASIAG